MLHGRCLPYGEGITYWPLAEVVRDILRTEGAASRSRRAQRSPRCFRTRRRPSLVAELISEALGLGGSGDVTGEQTFWAVRKLFEALARRRPLVVVFDDLQWAEPTFLELVDYLADQSRDAPILLLCMARPELFDSHPGWGGGKRHAATISLEPLREDDSRRLIANLLGRGLSRPTSRSGSPMLPRATRSSPRSCSRCWSTTRRSRGTTAAGWLRTTSPSCVFRRRSTRSSPRDSTLARGASARCSYALRSRARVFHYGALRELAPESPMRPSETNLASLVRRDIIRPDRSSFPGDDAYRFRHLLIRDAAYWSLAKATRADLHERFAAWLERTAGGAIRGYEEIVGYHLEQAYR